MFYIIDFDYKNRCVLRLGIIDCISSYQLRRSIEGPVVGVAAYLAMAIGLGHEELWASSKTKWSPWALGNALEVVSKKPEFSPSIPSINGRAQFVENSFQNAFKQQTNIPLNELASIS